MSIEQIVYIVDDEEAVRKSLCFLAKSAGLKCQSFESAQLFLDSFPHLGPGCLLLDVCMPDMSGLELQEVLHQNNVEIPIIIITGHADVPTAVQAMKHGASDFIEKPFDGEKLLECIQQCLDGEAERRCSIEWRKQANKRLSHLTPRECQVMHGMVTGQLNKQIADQLCISTRTVELHRAHLMEKLAAKSLSDVVRIAILSDNEN